MDRCVYEIQTPIYISIWSWNSKEEHRFLGCCLLSIETILSHSSVNEWIDLGKRSNRSHVSGQIRIEISTLPSTDCQPLYNLLPSSPLDVFKSLLKHFLVENTLDFENQESSVLKLLTFLVSKWRIPRDYYTCM